MAGYRFNLGVSLEGAVVLRDFSRVKGSWVQLLVLLLSQHSEESRQQSLWGEFTTTATFHLLLTSPTLSEALLAVAAVALGPYEHPISLEGSLFHHLLMCLRGNSGTLGLSPSRKASPSHVWEPGCCC